MVSPHRSNRSAIDVGMSRTRKGIAMFRHKRLFVALFLTLLTVFVTAVPTLAQYTTGQVVGIVTDPNNAAVVGAVVTLKNQTTNAVRTYATGRNGMYSFPAVPPGQYQLSIRATGFGTTELTFTASSSATITQNVALKVRSQNAVVQVAATSTDLNTSDASLQTTQSAKNLEALPNVTRSPSGLATLAPGVTPMYDPNGGGALVAVSGAQTGLISAYGSRARATAASLDYTDINDWEFGGFALGTQPPVDMVSSYTTYAGVVPPEYGVESSNIVAVTKSGSNFLHGDAYDFIENDFFNARDYFDTTGKPTPLKQNLFGFTVGGPIQKGRTFFFGGYQKTITRGAGNTIVFPVPTAEALSTATDQAALQLFKQNVPLPANAAPGAQTGLITQVLTSPASSYLYLIRGDHQFSGTHSLSARYLYSTTTATLPFFGINFLNGFGADFDTGAHSVNITDTYLHGSNIVNQLRVAYSRSYGEFNAQDNSPTPRIDFNSAFYSFGEAQFFPQGRLFNVYQINDTFNYVHGGHLLQFGADVRYIQDNSRSTTSGGVRGTLTFNSLSDYLSGRPASWSRVFGATYEGYRMWVPGFFAQDQWNVLPTLTFNYGIRYDIQGAMNEVHGLISELDPNLQGIPIGAAGAGPLGAFRTGNPGIGGNYGNIQPRFGFTWNPRGGKAVIRGGYGMFFDVFDFALLANTRFGPPLNYTVQLGPTQFTNGNTFDNLLNGTAPIESETQAQIGSFGTLKNFGSLASVVKHLPNPYTQNYSLGLQYQLTRKTVFSVDYLGSISRNLTDLGPINSVKSPPTPPTSLASEQACIGTATAPGPCTLAANNEYGAGNDRIDPRFDQVDMLDAYGSSNYNALTVQLKQMTARGLDAQFSYTYSKSLDNDSDYNTAQVSNEESYPQGQGEKFRQLEYGPSDFDITHRIVLTTVWQVPFYQRQHGLIGNLAGGWAFTTLNLWQSGAPASIYSGPRLGFTDVNLDGNLNQTTGSDNTRASLNPGGVDFKFGKPSTIPAPSARGVNGTPNSSNFKYVQPYIGNYGTLGRNTFRMNSLPTIDWSVIKQFKLFDRGPVGSGPWALELRMDAFNVFNHPFLTAAGYQTWNNLANPSFGQYNSAGNMRQLQLAAKINF